MPSLSSSPRIPALSKAAMDEERADDDGIKIQQFQNARLPNPASQNRD
jgi:hypothetical protein